MKFLKGLFLTLIVICMVVVLLVLQVQIIVQKTILSPEFLEKAYDDSNMTDVLSALLDEQLDSFIQTDEYMDMQEDTALDISDKIDAEWLTEELEQAVLGVYGYIMGSEKTLPTINIEPIKDAMIDLAGEMMDGNLGVDDIYKWNDDIISEYNDLADATLVESYTIDDEAINKLKLNHEFENIDAGYYENVVVIYVNSKGTISDEDLYKEAKSQYLNDMIKTDEMKDELDLDDLMDSIYPDGSPIDAMRNIAELFKVTLFYALSALLILLVLIVVFTAFRPASIFGWLSGPMIAAGSVVASVGIINSIIPMFLDDMLASNVQGLGENSDNMLAFLQNYVGSIVTTIIMVGGIVFMTGIIFAILAGILKGARRRKMASEDYEKKRQPAWIMVIRVFVVLGLLGAIFFVERFFVIKIATEVVDEVNIISEGPDGGTDVISKTIMEEMGINIDEMIVPVE